MKARLIRGAYFIWIVVPFALWLVYTSYGLPHMIWSYSWINEGQGYDPFAERYYTRCTYVGSYGNKTISPENGKCPFIRFVKKEGKS